MPVGQYKISISERRKVYTNFWDWISEPCFLERGAGLGMVGPGAFDSVKGCGMWPRWLLRCLASKSKSFLKSSKTQRRSSNSIHWSDSRVSNLLNESWTSHILSSTFWNRQETQDEKAWFHSSKSGCAVLCLGTATCAILFAFWPKAAKDACHCWATRANNPPARRAWRRHDLSRNGSSIDLHHPDPPCIFRARAAGKNRERQPTTHHRAREPSQDPARPPTSLVKDQVNLLSRWKHVDNDTCPVGNTLVSFSEKVGLSLLVRVLCKWRCTSKDGLVWRRWVRQPQSSPVLYNSTSWTWLRKGATACLMLWRFIRYRQSLAKNSRVKTSRTNQRPQFLFPRHTKAHQAVFKIWCFFLCREVGTVISPQFC